MGCRGTIKLTCTYWAGSRVWCQGSNKLTCTYWAGTRANCCTPGPMFWFPAMIVVPGGSCVRVGAPVVRSGRICCKPVVVIEGRNDTWDVAGRMTR